MTLIFFKLVWRSTVSLVSLNYELEFQFLGGDNDSVVPLSTSSVIEKLAICS